MKIFISISAVVALFTVAWTSQKADEKKVESAAKTTHSTSIADQSTVPQPEGAETAASDDSLSKELAEKAPTQKRHSVRKPVLSEFAKMEINSQSRQIELKRKLRRIRRRSNGNYSEIFNVIAKEMEGDDQSEEYQKILRFEWFNHAIEQPGEPAVDALRKFAEKNRDNPEVLNEYAWLIVKRKMAGELVPVDLIDAAVYAIEFAVKDNTPLAHIYHTMAHLYEYQGKINLAIAAAQKAVSLCKPGSAFEYKNYLSELLKKKSQAATLLTAG